MGERSTRSRGESSDQERKCGRTSGHYSQYQAESLRPNQQRHILHGLLAVPGRLQEGLHGHLQGSLGLVKLYSYKLRDSSCDWFRKYSIKFSNLGLGAPVETEQVRSITKICTCLYYLFNFVLVVS